MDQKQNKKFYNLKDIRDFLELTQNELASLAGITGVYLSQIEKGNRPLTDATAEKLVRAFIQLMDKTTTLSDLNNPKIISMDAYDVKWFHIASFYPDDVRERIVELSDKKQSIELEMTHILKSGELLDEFWSGIRYDDEISRGDKPLIYDELIKNMKIVEDNIRQLRVANAFKQQHYTNS